MEHASNVLFTIGPLEVTSAVTTMWAIIAALTLVSWLATRSLKEVPGPLQSAAEIAIEKLRDYYEGLLGKEHARKYFPVFATFFVFIIICNYSGLLPGAGHIRGFALPTASLSVCCPARGISAALRCRRPACPSRRVSRSWPSSRPTSSACGRGD